MQIQEKSRASTKMVTNKAVLSLGLTVVLALSACSRQQSDWEKTRTANTADAYELFLKKYPTGEFTAQANARIKELYEERDWQKARDTDTQEAYQAFLKQYPEGKWAEEARIRVENFTLAQAPPNAAPAGAESANPPGGPAAAAAGAAGAATAPAPSATVPTARPQPSAAVPKSAATPKAKAGSYGIQLGAFKSSADAANRRWAHLTKEYPKLLAGLSPTVSPKKSASGTLYRLQVTGLTEKHARALCKSLKSKSQGCLLTRGGAH
jgi:cell division septation protein DedD